MILHTSKSIYRSCGAQVYMLKKKSSGYMKSHRFPNADAVSGQAIFSVKIQNVCNAKCFISSPVTNLFAQTKI